ncbi:hypothetical protein CEW46_31870, partial [Bacillus cereus]
MKTFIVTKSRIVEEKVTIPRGEVFTIKYDAITSKENLLRATNTLGWEVVLPKHAVMTLVPDTTYKHKEYDITYTLKYISEFDWWYVKPSDPDLRSRTLKYQEDFLWFLEYLAGVTPEF